MKPGRIDELLRQRPPDEGSYAAALDLDDRRRRRPSLSLIAVPVLAIAVLGIAAGVLGGRLLAGTPGLSPGPAPSSTLMSGRVSPSIHAEPSPSFTAEPTRPASAYDRCRADDLAMVADGWNGATGTLSADAVVINVGNATCRLAGKPSVQLVVPDGDALTAPSIADPSAGSALALAPGDSAGTSFAWGNWCTDAPAGALTLRLFLGGGFGTLNAEIKTAPGSSLSPRCDLPRTGPTFSAIAPFHRLQP